MYLAFLLVMRLLGSSFGLLGNGSQTSWWQNRHFHHSWLVSQRGGQTSIPHAYRQILFFVLLFSLVGDYVSVCELDVTINVSVDALLANELVSHFWDLETAQWCCRCLRGIVDVACVVSLCFCLLCVVDDVFSFVCFSWMNRLSDKWQGSAWHNNNLINARHDLDTCN